MAESIKLKNINVFESEEQYNENKDTINVNDLSLVPADYLPTAGGTLTGRIYFSNFGGTSFIKDNIGADSEAEPYQGLYIQAADTTGSGAYLTLRSANAPEKPGDFEINAQCGSKKVILNGTADGILTWDKKNILTTETYKDGNNWYRKYSDGWIEQGGNIDAVTPSASLKTITFPTNFSSISYQFLMTVDGSIGTSGGSSNFCMTTSDKTATSIKVSVHSADIASGTLDWYACGY